MTPKVFNSSDCRAFFPKINLWHGVSKPLFIFSVVTSLIATGCGTTNELGRLPISGEVKLAGQPVALGSIEFSPVNGGVTSSGATIIEGKYSIAPLKGLPPGQYIVRISVGLGGDSHRSPEALAESHGKLSAGVELVPKEYNIASQLTFEVRADADNKFDFDIPTTK